MLGLFRKQTEPHEGKYSDELMWMEYASTTSSLVREVFEGSCELFALLAGATFALQQDTLRMYGIDMRRMNDSIWNVAVDKMQPHRFGNFPERAHLTLKALQSIDDVNLDAMESLKSADLSEEDRQVQLVLCRMRSTAARTWTMSMLATTDTGKNMVLPVATIWMMLQVVDASEALEEGTVFTGTYFEDVRSDPMNPKHWPYIPEGALDARAE